MKVRVPGIVQQTIDDIQNEITPKELETLTAFHQGMLHNQKIPAMSFIGAPDAELWIDLYETHKDMSWQNVKQIYLIRHVYFYLFYFLNKFCLLHQRQLGFSLCQAVFFFLSLFFYVDIIYSYFNNDLLLLIYGCVVWDGNRCRGL